ncbi:histidine phosphatase family protein [Novosphingobium huizhouense]|uniref:histidine phosphatase family protein n=1 Tax=Novosphingobium huizhouense TaxID=2866625 RepID=UPI001CD90A46|nr:histidine phosphatase family protein [Novosphingobium huizhouense]
MNGRTIHLLRHGPPRRAGLLLGHRDEPAADPAGGLGGAVPAGLAMSCIVSSDLQRARTGAQTLAQQRGLALTIDSRWRELDFGDWDGLAPENLPAEALSRFWNDPEACPPPRGERWSALCARVAAALCDLPDDALVVTHGGAMRAAVAAVTGLDFRQVWAFDLPYAALLGLRIWPAAEAGAPPSGQIVRLHSGAMR